jgi:hypothetical protein
LKKRKNKMISHLRLATANPGYKPPGCFTGRTALNSGSLDRTGALQNSLTSFFHQVNNQTPSRFLATGDMPSHVGGRGHLEGSCMAKGEGLLESKKEKRKKKGHKKGKKGEEGYDKEDCYDNEDSSDDDEEERKVWKPASMCGGGGTEHANPFSSSSVKLPQNQQKDAKKTSNLPSGIDGDIESLNREGLDWSKTSKYGKKSNHNFQEWLDEIAKKMHAQQREAEDTLFSTAF